MRTNSYCFSSVILPRALYSLNLVRLHPLQLQYIVDRFDVKTLPELLDHLRLDRLLSADGPLIDGILSAGTTIILGGGTVRPTVIQPVPWSRDYDRQPRQRPTGTIQSRSKIIRMALMGRPVRTPAEPYHRVLFTTLRHKPRAILANRVLPVSAAGHGTQLTVRVVI